MAKNRLKHTENKITLLRIAKIAIVLILYVTCKWRTVQITEVPKIIHECVIPVIPLYNETIRSPIFIDIFLIH